jgi:hypothetical protein
MIAIWGIPGYTSRGIYKELRKLYGSSVQGYIIAARTAQGYEDFKNATDSERLDIISSWNERVTKQSQKQGYAATSRYTCGVSSMTVDQRLTVS